MVWSAIGAIGSALIGGGFSALGQERANRETREATERGMAFSAEQAEINRAWQERMASTRYQRTMRDMRAAGLNPILAYRQGGGPIPSGGQAAGMSYQAGNIGAAAPAAASSAINAWRTGMEQKRQKELLYNMRSQTELNYERGRTEAAQQKLITEQANEVINRTPTHSAQQNLMRSQAAVNKLQEMINKAEVEIRRAGATSAKETQRIYQTWYGRFLRWVDETGRAFNPFAQAGKTGSETFRRR